MGIELVKKQGHINLTAPKAIPVDLSNYYTKIETDGKIQEAINNIDIPEVDLSGYATVDYVDNAVSNIDLPDVSGFLTADDLENYTTKDYVSNALTPYAKTSEIPDVSNFATKAEIPDTSNFITEIPAEYVTESELNSKGYLTQHQSLADYSTTTQVQSMINTAISSITDGDEVSY